MVRVYVYSRVNTRYNDRRKKENSRSTKKSTKLFQIISVAVNFYARVMWIRNTRLRVLVYISTYIYTHTDIHVYNG